MTDIRSRSIITHADVLSLNFVRQDTPFRFRRHHRQGLRSHILEVLDPSDLALERTGRIENGLRRFPRALPRWMMRIFRKVFPDRRSALEEAARFQYLQIHLPVHSYAMSTEFLADYRHEGRKEIVLCGLQQFVSGREVDPWALSDINDLRRHLAEQCPTPPFDATEIEARLRYSVDHIERLVTGLKRMIARTGYIPDLAGIGNLILTPKGRIKLVDINNISRVRFDGKIHLDDKDYPAVDKSIEALFRFENRILGKADSRNDPLYGRFMDPARMAESERLVRAFHDRIAASPDPGGIAGGHH